MQRVSYLRCSDAVVAVAVMTYHDALMNEAASIACRPQMRVLLGTSDSHVPDLTPCLVQVVVHRVDPGVVWRHCIAHVHCDVVRLQQQHSLHLTLRNAAMIRKHSNSSNLCEDAT